MNQQQPVIECENIGYFYQRRKGYFSKQKYWALEDVSFMIKKGESIGVIGRNGAGKSTLLRLLAGIIAPDRGKLVNHGYTTSLLSLQAGFIPYLTGRENTIMSGLSLGLPKSLILERMENIGEFAGLGDFFEQPISSYSSGMRARLGFAIAFQLDPDVLLIDEVLGVGDKNFKDKSTKMMKEKIRSEKTVVLVSHSAPTIKDLCDRAIWIENGVSLMVGNAESVLRAYGQVSGKKPVQRKVFK